jgi:phage-related protein
MPEVQTALTNLFRALNQIAATAAPLLGQALLALGPVINALAPSVQALLTALGPALSSVIGALGPVLTAAAQALSALAVAVVPVITLLGQLIAASLPILTPMINALTLAIQGLAPIFAQIAGTVGSALLPILTALVTQVMPPLMQVFTEIITAVLPVFAQLLTALQPAINEMSTALLSVVTALAPLLVALAQLIGPLLGALMPVLLPIIQTIGQLASIFANELAAYIQNIVVPALKVVTSLLQGDFHGAFENAKELVKGMINEAIRLFIELPGKIFDAIISLDQKLIEVFGRAIRAGVNWLRDHRSDITDFFSDLPGNILSAIGDLGSLLWNTGKKILEGLIGGVRSKLNDLKGLLNSVTDLIPDWKGPADKDAALLTPAGRSIMGGLMTGIGSQLPALRGQLQGVTAEIAGMSLGTLAGPQLTTTAPALPGSLAAAPVGVPGPALAAPSVPAVQGAPSITIQAININGSFDMASAADRRRIADALVIEIKDALRDYDRGRAR